MCSPIRLRRPRIRYDQYPLVYVTAVFKWGFQGYNFHWEASRQYTWAEVITNLYEVADEELNSVEKLPIAKLVQRPDLPGIQQNLIRLT